MAFILLYVVLNILSLVVLFEFLEDSFSKASWAWVFRIIKFSADLIFLLLVFFVLRRYIFDSDTHPGGNKLKYLSLALIGGLTMVVIQPSITVAFSYIPGFEVFRDHQFVAVVFKPTDVFYIVSTTLLAPISEELFFRGFLLKGLLRKYKSWIAILISAFIFGIWHFNFFDPNILVAKHIFVTFIGGLAMGYLYFKSEKLIYPIIFHVCWNILVVINDYVELPLI